MRRGWVNMNMTHHIRDRMKESISIVKTNVFNVVIEKYPLECLFIILFFLMSVYFRYKVVAFLCEHVRAFYLNTVKILSFKT